METGALIRLLTESCEPVRPLPRPWTRTAEWLAIALAYVALVVFVVSPRADLAAKFFEWRFVVEQVAALATATAAAVAAFAMIIPGYSRKLLALPFLPFSLWFASLGQAYVQDNIRDRVRLDPDALTLHPAWYCFLAIVLVGLVPAIVMTMMLRSGAPRRLRLTAALGGLAAAALGGFGLRFFCPQDASSTVLVWQFGTVCMLSVLAGCAGRQVLKDRRKALRA
jgi:hypothetical protein